jgi:hypothetical protein
VTTDLFISAGTAASAVKGAQPHSNSSALNKGSKSPVPGVSAVQDVDAYQHVLSFPTIDNKLLRASVPGQLMPSSASGLSAVAVSVGLAAVDEIAHHQPQQHFRSWGNISVLTRCTCEYYLRAHIRLQAVSLALHQPLHTCAPSLQGLRGAAKSLCCYNTCVK